jgi:transaldolase
MFAGRIVDTGRDPVPMMTEALDMLRAAPQADAIGCHIITVTAELLRTLEWVGRALTERSLDTVRISGDDAVRTGFELGTWSGRP